MEGNDSKRNCGGEGQWPPPGVLVCWVPKGSPLPHHCVAPLSLLACAVMQWVEGGKTQRGEKKGSRDGQMGGSLLRGWLGSLPRLCPLLPRLGDGQSLEGQPPREPCVPARYGVGG